VSGKSGGPGLNGIGVRVVELVKRVDHMRGTSFDRLNAFIALEVSIVSEVRLAQKQGLDVIRVGLDVERRDANLAKRTTHRSTPGSMGLSQLQGVIFRSCEDLA